MAEGLFDTTFFVDAVRGDRAARELLDEVAAGNFEGYFSPISVMELAMSENYTPAEDSFFHGVFSRLTELAFDLRAARLAGLYLRGLDERRREALLRDAMIATTAVVNGLPVVTRNVRDMRLFTDSVRRY